MINFNIWIYRVIVVITTLIGKNVRKFIVMNSMMVSL